MTAIAHYAPSREVAGMLRVAAEMFDAEGLRIARGVILSAVADELATDAASPSEWFRYYLGAPETAAKVDALIQATRTRWMADPS